MTNEAGQGHAAYGVKIAPVPVVFGTIRAVPPWRQVFNLSVESVPVMACCGQPAGCGMLVAGGFCYGRLVDESSIARESQNSPDSLWGQVFNLSAPTGSSASRAGGEIGECGAAGASANAATPSGAQEDHAGLGSASICRSISSALAQPER